MQVILDRQKAAELVDTLIELRRKNQFPYDSLRATLPQNMIPEEIRKDTELLARFYFFVCLYMRGGIESHTAFKQLIRVWREHPELFDAKEVSQTPERRIYSILKRFVGWDAKNASIFWKRNAALLATNWNGSARHIVRSITSYEEAVRIIANSKGRLSSLDAKELGFWGFQHKMVSMLLYFFDCEGWLETGFNYPSPADFHHYRIFLATKVLRVVTEDGRPIRYSEKISKKIRPMLVWYQKSRNVTPIELADALWLFSLLLCGNSPATATAEDGTCDFTKWKKGKQKQFHETCGACPLEPQCKFAIPSKKYYRRGVIDLRPRPELHEVYRPAKQLNLLPDD